MSHILCILLFRILLPILITTCIIFRPSGLSALYLLVLFYLPFVPVPTEQTMSGHTGIFLKILIVLTSLTALGQIIFQIVLAAMPPYAEFLENDELLEKILRHVGFIRLNKADPITVTVWLSPEIVMLAISIGFFLAMKKLSTPPSVEASNEEGEQSAASPPTKAKSKYVAYLVAIGRYCVLFALCSAAVLRPSIIGGLYFLVFLGTATWWSCCKQLGRAFAIVLGCLAPIVFIHLSTLYSYQFQWPQELLERNSTYARYFGLTQLVTVSSNSTDDPRVLLVTDEEWASFVNPLALYLLYYILILEVKGLLQPALIQGVSPVKRYGSGRKSGIFQDSTGSVTVTGENTEDIPLDDLGTIEGDFKPTMFENFLYAMETLLQIIIRSSYIGTNIIMMAWSITYLSWITFVLLIWANLIWLIPNQRRSMLYSSPILVFYALFLLISAYIYSMNLTDEELPVKVNGVNLEEIGFVKPRTLPCLPLYVKCLYSIMFWVTLRQFMQERMQQRQSNALADMVAPLQVTVGTAAGVNKEQEKGSKIIAIIGTYIKKFLTKFWIWIVAITLFAVAITGERMTVFRIMYMALFLFFILSFQLSFRIWRKMMFAFWLVVIIYSMIILVMVYTYQFDEFETYWRNIGVPVKQQLDIGLEKFKTKDLFVRLVTPTFFVIITVVQLHYFHKDFMQLSDPKNTSLLRDEEMNNEEDLDQSSLQGGAVIERSEKDDITSSAKFDLYELGTMSNAQFQRLVELWLKRLHRLKNLTYLFMELHMIKVVLLFAMLICVYDLCALYFVIVFLLSLALTFGRPLQIFAIYTGSLLASVLLLARMIFQIEYITPDNWNVTCGTGNGSYIANNAKWFGFAKTTAVPRLVKWNIAYILVVTLWSVILIRQHYYRISRRRPTTRAFFMFPRVTRADADKDLLTCLKYLANYGFYKFGFEISMMATVAVIGIRMDLYAVLYSIWLCIMFSMNRSALSRIWVFYLMFIAVLLPFQYFMAVGLPPTLCQEFPWNDTATLRALQDWAFLLDKDHPPAAKKLICDFVLLLIVSRQWVVFRIERRYAGKNYAGGSNESIIHHAEEKDFVNPVPDFITYVRSYLDIFKKGILLSFLWITLAIVFLAGTNRVNIFSMGYLIGAFVFLWHGSDFYLRPVRTILRQWHWLLGYNVLVIFLKASFQILGCVVVWDINIPRNFCWVVQVFGFGCVRKFGDLDLSHVHDMGPNSGTCKVPREFIGIAWDGICFGLLIIQRRIFNSYNFFHMVDETKATTILASRGAELIEQMRLKTMTDQEEIEHRILEKIKHKMDRIKANQQKMQVTYKDKPQLGRDTFFRPRYRRKPPVTYKEAIRSGDYYMFDDFEDEEIDLLPEETIEKESRLSEKLGLGEIEEHEPRSVRIRELPEDEDPQPGTSKDEDISELTEPRDTVRSKIINGLLFVWAFIESLMISLTNFLNGYSRNYRYVLKVLAREKKILKEKTNYNVGLRLGSTQVWQPAASYQQLLEKSMDSPSSPRLETVEELSSYDQPTIVKLLLAIWYIIMSRSEILCYFVIFLNQIKTATFMSLPLPLMVFFWGSLTIPRPSKTFWVTIIAYTEVIVLIKCLFQFDIMQGHDDSFDRGYESLHESNPFYAPKIIGIYRQKNYALWDLLLLLVVFFHRVLLKSMGIWSATPVPAAMIGSGKYKMDEGQLVRMNSSSKTNLQTQLDNSQSTSKKSDSTMHDDVYSIETSEEEPLTHLPQTLQLATARYADSLKTFFHQLVDPTSRVAADVYSFMFFCDFFNFFVILIGFSAFGTQQDGGVSSYLQDNRVPPLFLFMLILQFMLIVTDRGIYLRRNILGKIIFQFLQIILLHVWLFILFPLITGSQVNTVLPPQMYYMMKCFYLLLSAYQIRCGYPTRILGNFLCKGYGMVNMFLFKGFMLIPFLFELRTIMDWMWTETSMTVFDWIKMEDIFAHIYQLKCSRNMEDDFPQPRGQKKNPSVKYAMGTVILVCLIGLIWFPLVFFSLGNAVGTPNIPYDVTLEIRIGPYEPVYKISAQSNSIKALKEGEMAKFRSRYRDSKAAQTFLSNYEAADVAFVTLSVDSANIWSISPPDRKRMVAEINSTYDVKVRLEYKVSHKTSNPEDSGVVPDNVEILIPATVDGEPNEVRTNLLAMLEGRAVTSSTLFKYILPKFLKVTSRGTAAPIDLLMLPKPVEEAKKYRNITLNLLRSGGQEWWQIHEECDDYNFEMFLKGLPHVDCDNSVVLYTFNDKIFPPTLNFVTGAGIIGLYTTLVFVASRILRGFFADQCAKIMFEDLPNVDRVLQLCLDVYLVREAREFALEEDLFAKLVFLFRSPETLIKWSRPKEELADDDDPEGEGQ